MSFEVYLLILVIVCTYVSATDFLYRKIQNHALLIVLFLQCFLSPLDIQIMSFLLVLGGGLIVYALIWIGAGDIKYAAVLSLTIPLNDLHWAFVMTAFSGGFLAVVYLVNNKLRNKKLTRSMLNDRQGIPYGIAISVGFYLVILTQNTPHI
ncbi:peptidase [Vibrio splendidus]|uniref:Peptidase n=1 Tax=Vibrio splendidus TaxID=29497 RepID=A0A2T5ESG3_VIBSP|nr:MULTISPECIES: prepilin peptidase [Vibrio]MBO7910495.1 prepilin peptidase [Vibrio sp. G41H]MCF7489327.1 prepilin peptidase [Vibrio sp. G-C-1]OEF68133.1 peptidase [Vibrio splendidus 1F-157]PMJ02063.1 peptidase [Vibrio splendidus]PMJ82948.1 peptidase [Vibrio splendidus]